MLKSKFFSKNNKKKKTLVADLGFNFMGCAISLTLEYKWNWGSRGGRREFCTPEANTFRANCSLKPV